MDSHMIKKTIECEVCNKVLAHIECHDKEWDANYHAHLCTEHEVEARLVEILPPENEIAILRPNVFKRLWNAIKSLFKR